MTNNRISKQFKNAIRKVLPLRTSSFIKSKKEILSDIKSVQTSIDNLSTKEQVRGRKIDSNIQGLNNRIDSLQHNETLSKIQQSTDAVDKDICALNSAIGNLENSVNTSFDKLDDAINSLDSSVGAAFDKLNNSLNDTVCYEPCWERDAIEPFHEILDSDELADRFRALVSGMDKNSIQTVATIIARQRLVLDNPGRIDLYSDEEKKAVSNVRWQMKNSVARISDDLFCFDGYLLPIRHFEPCVFIYRYGLDKILKTGQTLDKDIIDVGAFVGDTAILLAPLTTGNVISFEASEENFSLLLKTIELNGCNNVIPEHLSLGSKIGTFEFDFNGSMTKAIGLSSRETIHNETVAMTTLDKYCSDHNISVGMIKVDIEGYEQEFLKGAKETITRDRPILLLSIYHNPSDFFDIKPMIESWNLDYRFSIHKPTDFTISREVLLIAEPR